MTLIDAIASNKPFRRPSWVLPDDEFQWVVYNFNGDFEWANDDGTPSGNVFGDIYNIITQNPVASNDYEIKLD